MDFFPSKHMVVSEHSFEIMSEARENQGEYQLSFNFFLWIIILSVIGPFVEESIRGTNYIFSYSVRVWGKSGFHDRRLVIHGL